MTVLLGFQVLGLNRFSALRVQDLGFRVNHLGFRVQGCRVQVYRKWKRQSWNIARLTLNPRTMEYEQDTFSFVCHVPVLSPLRFALHTKTLCNQT